MKYTPILLRPTLAVSMRLVLGPMLIPYVIYPVIAHLQFDIISFKDNGSATGIGNARSSVNRAMGTRSYAASGYYCRSVQQDNFHVLMDAQVCAERSAYMLSCTYAALYRQPKYS